LSTEAAEFDRMPAGAYNDSVVPGEDSKLIETGDQVPSSGDVASYKDAESQDGEGVHRIRWDRAEPLRNKHIPKER